MAVSFRGPRSPGPYVWDIICVSLLLSMSLVSSTICCWDVCLACSPHIRGTVILCHVHPAHFLFGHQQSTLP
ncbi:hypothetical protein C8F04DRAFT_1058516 [Mycena alexandri]|uniref:Uncharacterized protein n=1 Tax=Mycena alexandri TaxID=1745969 RepID=A0AAD6TP12_9AGAR|nr:hypothetical protein C8F04DRAFT_1058516 [Mycena alexandri]